MRSSPTHIIKSQIGQWNPDGVWRVARACNFLQVWKAVDNVTNPHVMVLLWLWLPRVHTLVMCQCNASMYTCSNEYNYVHALLGLQWNSPLYCGHHWNHAKCPRWTKRCLWALLYVAGIWGIVSWLYREVSSFQSSLTENFRCSTTIVNEPQE